METREINYSGVFDQPTGFGVRPAVIVIDFILAYVTPGAPFYAKGVVDAVASSVPLLKAARAASVPIIYTKVLYHRSGSAGVLFVTKVPALPQLDEGEPMAGLVPQLAHPPRQLTA